MCELPHQKKSFFFKTFINSRTYNYIKCLPFNVCVCNLYYLILIKAFGLLLTHSTVSVQQGEGLQMLLFLYIYSNWMGLDPHYWAVHCLSGMFITHLPLYVRAVSVPVF